MTGGMGALQGFGGFLAELPAAAPGARRLLAEKPDPQPKDVSAYLRHPRRAARRLTVKSEALKSSQFDVSAFPRQPDRARRCTAGSECHPQLAAEASAVVAIFVVDLVLGALGSCTGAARLQ